MFCKHFADSKVSAIVAPVVVFVLLAALLLVGFFYWRRWDLRTLVETQ